MEIGDGGDYGGNAPYDHDRRYSDQCHDVITFVGPEGLLLPTNQRMIGGRLETIHIATGHDAARPVSTSGGRVDTIFTVTAGTFFAVAVVVAPMQRTHDIFQC